MDRQILSYLLDGAEGELQICLAKYYSICHKLRFIYRLFLLLTLKSLAKYLICSVSQSLKWYPMGLL